MEFRTNLRNIAIIAHVDHGKTTLVDELLKQSGTFKDHESVNERAMDNNDIEKERGITILAKNTAVQYHDTRINILDTPGHADFGGEVERILKMVDGVVLIVDAFEGCMPQTRFVLKKALELNLTPVVVVNKIDKPSARPAEVVDEVIDLFIDLGADDSQLDFPVVYASAIQGTSSLNDAEQDDDMTSLFKTIIESVPAPVENSSEPFQFQVTMLDYNEYLGRMGIGRIFRGTMKLGDQAVLIKRDGTKKSFRVTKIFGFLGLKKLEIEEAKAGDLIAIAGVEDINVGETICPAAHLDPLPILRIDEPTLQMTFAVNNSPFAGREGTHVTSRKVEARLMTQVETDVSLKVENTSSPDIWTVSGRGELHLSILIENLRREGYELQVSKPEVIIREIDGKQCEPFEMAQIDVPEEFTGPVMESVGERKGELINMVNKGDGQVRMEFLIPSRGLIGYTTEFMAQTKGYGILNHTFEDYKPVVKGFVAGRRQGALVSMENGKSTIYGMLQVEDRGTLFIEPGTEIYEGMIVGENSREHDLTVNVVKMKQQTNIRSANKDNTVTMKRPRILTLEEALEFLNDDEYCEVTPESIRLRKKILDKATRERENKKSKLTAKN